MGATLNGLGEFDQTDWSGDYEPTTSGEWTGGAIYSDFVPDAPSSPNLTVNAPASQFHADSSATASPNVLSDLLKFGTALIRPQPTQQPQRAAMQMPKSSINNAPLLIFAALAAAFIISRK